MLFAIALIAIDCFRLLYIHFEVPQFSEIVQKKIPAMKFGNLIMPQIVFVEE